MLEARLKVLGGKHQGKAIPLAIGRFLVGRERDCHLRPSSDLVSRHLCVFYIDEYAVRLRDLGSLNGTLVIDERLQGEQAVEVRVEGRDLAGTAAGRQQRAVEDLPDPERVSADSLRKPETDQVP